MYKVNLRPPNARSTPKFRVCGLTRPTPETPPTPWSEFSLPRSSDHGLSFFVPGKYRVWGGLIFGLGFARTTSQKHWGRGRRTSIDFRGGRGISEAILACCWEGVKAPPSFWQLPGLPRISPDFPGISAATCPELPSLATEIYPVQNWSLEMP